LKSPKATSFKGCWQAGHFIILVARILSGSVFEEKKFLIRVTLWFVFSAGGRPSPGAATWKKPPTLGLVPVEEKV
jgi:hypothetical protein